ncbi:MAG TPA: response regulator transcription factor [Candidatus Anaerostipes avistercoris]|uniref:Stage 0 sporulation protein A homolog n=1 Tax=Candidatus Anaerostipes avistercoris TaxID=2838462 RepID=A0A9D2T8Z0_9FIRM|nr:response regulator transcription factor [Candidatus Anaerostipes avistercoris]
MDQILIVEDDGNINQLLFEALTKEGYFCEQAYSGTEAKRLLAGGQYALVLLDLMLPGMPGEEVLASLREEDQTPVIVLTAKDQLDDKVDLLKGGADDYVTKPFNIEEVLARVQVQMRRKSQEAPSQTLSYKDMVIHKDTFQIEIRGVELPKITKQEFAILELLLRHPKKVFSKEEIFEYAWDEVYMGETKTLDVHISNIRKKIKQVTNEGYIETVWGIGYRLQR